MSKIIGEMENLAYHHPFLIGTSGWSYKDWQGRFYPAYLPAKQWFPYYVDQFKTVEINATYYRSFKDSLYQRWYEQVPADFRFVIKAHRIIVHRKNLLGGEVARCWRSATLLKEKLGLLLLQFSPNFPYDLERLNRLLLAFPDPQKLAVEFRHVRWLTSETYSLLKELKVTFCNADSGKMQLYNWVSSPIGYIRLHGREKVYDYSQKELDLIAMDARHMRQKGAKTVYVFFNNDLQGLAVKNALDLKNILG